MDNLEEIKEQEYIEQYINDAAKYKIGDIVGYYENNKIQIGFVSDRYIAYKKYTNSDKTFSYIVYGVITPIGKVTISEVKLFYLSDYICRRYANYPSKL